MSNNAALKSICVAFPKFIALIEGVFQVYLVLACMTVSCRFEARAFVFQSEQVQTVHIGYTFSKCYALQMEFFYFQITFIPCYSSRLNNKQK